MALSAGADVREKLDAEGRVRRMELFARLYDELTGFPKPTVAACHGSCVGGGAEIAVACDLRVGGSNLRMRFPGAALGVPVGPARLVSLCGLSVAKYLLLTARDVTADEALRWGLVHRVAPAARDRGAGAHPRRRDRRASARGGGTPEADASRLGRRRGALPRRGRGPGRVAALGAWASVRGLAGRLLDLVPQLDHPAVENARSPQLHRGHPAGGGRTAACRRRARPGPRSRAARPKGRRPRTARRRCRRRRPIGCARRPPRPSRRRDPGPSRWRSGRQPPRPPAGAGGAS